MHAFFKQAYLLKQYVTYTSLEEDLPTLGCTMYKTAYLGVYILNDLYKVKSSSTWNKANKVTP